MDYDHELGVLGAENSQKTIDDLPNEILAHIFSEGARLRKNNQLYPSFPLLVSAVNSHWRLVAQSTPGLWTLIVPPLHKGVQACLDYMAIYLQRSGALPLSVVLDGRLGRTSALDPNSATLSIPDVFTLLVEMENITRLRRLDIWAHDSLSIRNAALHLLQRASCLQQFSLIYDEERIPPLTVSSIDHGTTWNWLARSQTIRKLRWSTGTDTPLVPNLTTLSAQNLSVTYEDLHTLFDTCPTLAHLILDGIQPMIVGPTRSGYRSIQVDSLRSIALRCNRGVRPGVTYIFHVLIIPNLAYLELDGTLSVSLLFGTSLSSTRVKTLRITNYAQASPHSNSQQDKDDLEILRSFSDLRHLQFVNAPTRNLLSRLSDAHRSSDAYARTRTHSINSTRGSDRARHGGPPIRKYDPFPPPRNFVTESEELQLLPWRKLHTISLDILSAVDLQYVCNLLILQKSIKRVELSPPTMRHLSDSLRRNNDMIYAIPWRASELPIIDNNIKVASKDVKEWLAKRVDLRLMEANDYGLLGGGRVPLSELP